MYKHIIFISAVLALLSCTCLAVCPYELTGDVNEDCVVDLLDVAELSENWLVNCNINPSDPACDTTQTMTDMQEDQFRYIKEGLELFREEFGEYPPSTDNLDLYDGTRSHAEDPTPYGGANKLAEALVGLDKLGFHPNSDFRSDGINVLDEENGGEQDIAVYHANFDCPFWETAAENLQNRKGPFIDPGVANVFEMQDVYQNTGGFRSSASSPSEIEQSLVLCDVFEKTRETGKVTGMPILYYRARDMYTQQKYDDADGIADDIYYYPDNHNLLELGMADGSGEHALSDGVCDILDFENMILDPRITVIQRPYRADGYILISAGPDGEYGTADDLFDFELLEDEPLPPASELKYLMQVAQLHAIEVGLEMYKTEFGNYPPSTDNMDLYDGTNSDINDPTPYGGANKLAEAMVGLDMLGFHPNSDYRSDGLNVRDDGTGMGTMEEFPVYHADFDDFRGNGDLIETAEENIQARKGPYLDLENARAFEMQDVYGSVGPFRYTATAPSEISQSLVICDVFVKNRGRGKYTGTPILYYRARRMYTQQDCSDASGIADDIYYYADNWNLLNLGVNAGFSYGYYPKEHPLGDGVNDFLDFENMILNPLVTTIQRPYRADSYILISAGEDGVYGTSDDITNYNY